MHVHRSLSNASPSLSLSSYIYIYIVDRRSKSRPILSLLTVVGSFVSMNAITRDAVFLFFF